MNKAILVCAIVCCSVGSAAAQCCGDCDGNGTVSINELITAVNDALGSCAGATPTPEPSPTRTRPPTATPTPADRCPFTFEDRGTLCSFRGRYNQGCGTELTSLLTSDGTELIVAIDTMLVTPPRVLFAAQIDGPTTAHLTAWSSDDFQTIYTTAGEIRFTDDREELIIFPNDSPFMITGCSFVRYSGAYVASTADPRRLAVALGDDASAALERLRAWRQRPVPDLADP